MCIEVRKSSSSVTFVHSIACYLAGCYRSAQIQWKLNMLMTMMARNSFLFFLSFSYRRLNLCAHRAFVWNACLNQCEGESGCNATYKWTIRCCGCLPKPFYPYGIQARSACSHCILFWCLAQFSPPLFRMSAKHSIKDYRRTISFNQKLENNRAKWIKR